jgi:hypothetical protein
MCCQRIKGANIFNENIFEVPELLRVDRYSDAMQSASFCCQQIKTFEDLLLLPNSYNPF